MVISSGIYHIFRQTHFLLVYVKLKVQLMFPIEMPIKSPPESMRKSHRGTGDAAELHQQQRQGGHRASTGAHELHLVLTDKAITVPGSCGVDENHEESIEISKIIGIIICQYVFDFETSSYVINYPNYWNVFML